MGSISSEHILIVSIHCPLFGIKVFLGEWPQLYLNFVWRYATPLDGSKMNKPSYGYEVLPALWSYKVSTRLNILWTAVEHKGWLCSIYPKPSNGPNLWFLWHTFYSTTHAQSHSTLNCSFQILQTCKLSHHHPSKFYIPALTWNSSKHMRQVSSAISIATGKMGSYIVILPILRFGRLCFSLWIPE